MSNPWMEREIRTLNRPPARTRPPSPPPRKPTLSDAAAIAEEGLRELVHIVHEIMTAHSSMYPEYQECHNRSLMNHALTSCPVVFPQ